MLKKSSFLTRTLSGVVLLAVFIGAIMLSPLTFVMLIMTITAYSMREFFILVTLPNLKPMVFIPIALGLLLVTINFFVAMGSIDVVWVSVPVLAMFALFFVELYLNKANPLLNVAVELLSIMYIAVPMSLLVHIPFAYGYYLPIVVLGYIFTVWINDVGAYLIGVSIGKHRLFERISPKKSWEGFFGGLIFSVVFAGFVGGYFFDKMMLWAILGAIISVTAVWGDLVESLIKRSAGVKDSGASIPGHGGFLDRFDAMFLSAPFVFAYMLFFDII